MLFQFNSRIIKIFGIKSKEVECTLTDQLLGERPVQDQTRQECNQDKAAVLFYMRGDCESFRSEPPQCTVVSPHLVA